MWRKNVHSFNSSHTVFVALVILKVIKNDEPNQII